MKGKINDLNKMKGNKIKATLLIAVFILSTLAYAIPIVSADPDLIVCTSQVLLKTDGTSTPEWIKEADGASAPNIYIGDYAVLTTGSDRHQVVVAYGKPLSTLVDLKAVKTGNNPVLDVGVNVYYETKAPYFTLLLDTTGDGAVDAAISKGFDVKEDGQQPVDSQWDVLYVTHPVETPPGGYGIYDVDQNGVLISQTYSGECGDNTNTDLDSILDDDFCEDPTVLYIGIGIVTNAGATYIDDIIIDGVIYDLEPRDNVEDTVTVFGFGATPGALINVYWEEIPAGYLAEGSASAIAPYAYSIDITIPEAIAGDHGIVAKDMESTSWATTTYTVKPEITLDPTSGIEGDPISVTGTGFAANKDITTMTYWDGSSDETLTTSPGTPRTNSLGSFTCDFDIPTDAETGDITMTDADSNTASDELTVGDYIKLTPDSGLIGETVTVEGRGFTAETDIDIRWFIVPGESVGDNYITIVEGYKTDPEGDFSTTFDVPLVSDPSEPGDSYTVMAYESESIKPTDVFTVIEEASITLTPDKERPDESFTVEGTWFTEDSTVDITFNGEVLAEDVATLSDGSFDPETVDVPEDAEPGDYTITATDAEGVTASETFTVLPPPAIVIETRATEYMPGDKVTFYINSTVEMDVDIDITDPSDYPFTSIDIDELGTGHWTKVGDYYVVPYDVAFFDLPSDATEGLWNWTAEYTIEAETVKSTDLFQVGEPVGPEPDYPATPTNQEALDSQGSPEEDFALGDTVLASATVTNGGNEIRSMLVVFQWTDPQLTALPPSYTIITDLEPGQSVTSAQSAILPSTGYMTGTWTAEVCVLTTWIAQGGTVIGTTVTITVEVTN